MHQATLPSAHALPATKRIVRRSHVRTHYVKDVRMNESGGVFQEKRTVGAARPGVAPRPKLVEPKRAEKKEVVQTGHKISRGAKAVAKTVTFKDPPPPPDNTPVKKECMGAKMPGVSPPSSGSFKRPHRLGSPGNTPGKLPEGRLARQTRRKMEKERAEKAQKEAIAKYPSVLFVA